MQVLKTRFDCFLKSKLFYRFLKKRVVVNKKVL
jgi:hypothetical protein